MLLHFALVLHFAAIRITFCVNITFCGVTRARSNIVICINPAATQMIYATGKPKILW